MRNKNPRSLLRAVAIRLRKAGVPQETVTEALRVPKWPIAGWLSHDTRRSRKY